MKITNLNNINFSAIIPRVNLNVQNKNTKDFVPATLYEIDCKDKDDYKEFGRLQNNWEYASSMKYSVLLNHDKAKYNTPIRQQYWEIKTPENETLAICRTFRLDGDYYDVEYLESKPESDYKFAGQAILAGITKALQEKNIKGLTVSEPVRSAIKFYEEKCGFPYRDYHLLWKIKN